MKEASPAKFYVAKYFFLAFGMLQWLCGMLLLLRGDWERNRWSALLFFVVGSGMLILYFRIASRLHHVTITRKRIAIQGALNETLEWQEVKSIKPIPYFNLYRMKLRGRKDRIYFLPREREEPLFGFIPHEPEFASIIRKKIR